MWDSVRYVICVSCDLFISNIFLDTSSFVSFPAHFVSNKYNKPPPKSQDRKYNIVGILAGSGVSPETL